MVKPSPGLHSANPKALPSCPLRGRFLREHWSSEQAMVGFRKTRRVVEVPAFGAGEVRPHRSKQRRTLGERPPRRHIGVLESVKQSVL